MKKTRNIIRYLLVMALNIWIMLTFHSYLNFLLFIGMIVFPIGSIYALNRIKSKLSFSISLPSEPMTKGSTLALRFCLHNASYLPLINATIKVQIANPFYDEERIHDLNIPVRGGQDTVVEYPIEMQCCGRLQVNVTQIRLLDWLGIYETVLSGDWQEECILLPQGEPKDEEAGQMYVNGVTEAMESKEKGYDFSEISGIREYVPGDKLQNIHWKLSVKKEELMVKERVNVSTMQLNVLLELLEDGQMGLESILELADSVTRSFAQNHLPFTIYYYSVKRKELRECLISNEEERINWLEMLFYEQAYTNTIQVENVFLAKYPETETYLYIGYATGKEIRENALYGRKNSIAMLKIGEGMDVV